MSLQQWWHELEARERRTLIIGAVVLAVFFFIQFVWLPAHREADRLAQQLAEQRALLAWMQQMASEAQGLRAAGGSELVGIGNQALFSFVDQSAREAGLGNALRQVEPNGEQRVRVTLQQANFDQLIHWLVTLKTRHGIDAGTFAVRRGDSPGLVDAQLILESSAP
ncbi:MAG: type II secretion system protein M [Xanthomonadaceae bacterium]|nr:type II secretion system protein M [Xanthomonadaceae bacterium]